MASISWSTVTMLDGLMEKPPAASASAVQVLQVPNAWYLPSGAVLAGPEPPGAAFGVALEGEPNEGKQPRVAFRRQSHGDYQQPLRGGLSGPGVGRAGVKAAVDTPVKPECDDLYYSSTT